MILTLPNVTNGSDDEQLSLPNSYKAEASS